MLFGRNMSARGYWLRIAVCVGIDLLDLTIGRALVLVPGEEIPIALVVVLLFGAKGLVYVAEIAELTEQFDAFIPMATLIGLWAGCRRGLWGQGLRGQGLRGRKAPIAGDITPPASRPRNSPSNW